jgi:phosphonate transport system permease protein
VIHSSWRKPPLVRSAPLRWAIATAGAAYLVVAVATLHIDLSRVAAGLERARGLFSSFLTPNLAARWPEVRAGLLESLAIGVVATLAGVLASLPLALGAARNLAPTPFYVACRTVLAIARAFHEVIVAIVLVAMFGFGPFAGALTLSFATVGFVGKLLAEEIESSDLAQLEAIRSTGATWAQTVVYAVQPQVAPRLLGLALYRLDINFRESAVIGIVGAGGIGVTLMTAMSRYEYDVAGGVLMLIIGVVLLVEYASAVLRRRLL